MKKFIYLLLGLTCAFQVKTHNISMMPGYENSIEGVKMYENGYGEPTIEFAFTHEDPVCKYIPVSFEESNNSAIRRYHIPLSDFNQDEVDEIAEYLQKMCKNIGVDLEISMCDAPCEGLECLFTLPEGVTVEKVRAEDRDSILFVLHKF